MHGMPLAALLGPEPAELAQIGGFVAEGAAGAHRAHRRPQSRRAREGRRSATRSVHVFTMKDIDRQGIASIVEQAVKLAGTGTAGIHVSFDMDVCDPSIAPGVGTPVKGGLDYREAHMVMEIVADSGPAHLARPGRSEPDARRAERDGAARHRARAVGARNEDSVSSTRRASLRASRRAAPANTASRSGACAAAAARARPTPTARPRR